MNLRAHTRRGSRARPVPPSHRIGRFRTAKVRPQHVPGVVPLHELRLLTGENAIRSRQQQRQTRINEVDPREPDREIAVQDDALIEEIVDDVEQRCVLRPEDLIGFRPPPRRFRWTRTYRAVRAHSTKLYGGHGPVSEKLTPTWRRSRNC